MAANVTEKDKALQEVIAWCDSRFDKACQYFSAASSGELAAQYLVAIYAYRGVIAHCRSMLGSGSMPSEVPNQSEDADLVMGKMVPERVNAILTPDSTGSKLILGHVQSYNDRSYRRRPASEILWAMVKANGKRTN